MKPSERTAEAVRKFCDEWIEINHSSMGYEHCDCDTYIDCEDEEIAAIIARETRCDEAVKLIAKLIRTRDGMHRYTEGHVFATRFCQRCNRPTDKDTDYCINQNCVRGQARALLAALKGGEDE